MYFLINNSDKYTSERNNASIILGDALLQPFGRSPKVSNESFISLLPTCHPDVHCWQLTWHSRNYIYFPLEASCPAPPFPTNPDSDPIPRRTVNPIPSPRNENEAKTSQPLRLRRSPPRRAAADNGRRRPAAAGGRGRPPAMKRSASFDRVPEEARRILHRLAGELWAATSTPPRSPCPSSRAP